MVRGWPVAVIGGFALATVAAFAVSVSHGPGASVSTAVPTPNSEGSIVLMGLNGRTTDPFFLAGGSYRATWSAWGETANEPPCTHSMALLAVDPNVSAESSMELAKSVQVPYTGTTAVVDIEDLSPGDYFIQITSACAWQIELRATRS